jgi:hypothetical protein
MPASSEAKAASLICTLDSEFLSGGSWKLPASRRLASTHHPEPSNQRTFAIRRRRLRTK